MKLKDNTINTLGIRPELLLAIMIADGIYSKYGQELVITSLVDGKHSATSLHYSGSAVDFRTRYFSLSDQNKVRDELKNSLTADYDVILEKDHIHLEYQPRR